MGKICTEDCASQLVCFRHISYELANEMRQWIYDPLAPKEKELDAFEVLQFMQGGVDPFTLLYTLLKQIFIKQERIEELSMTAEHLDSARAYGKKMEDQVRVAESIATEHAVTLDTVRKQRDRQRALKEEAQDMAVTRGKQLDATRERLQFDARFDSSIAKLRKLVDNKDLVRIERACAGVDAVQKLAAMRRALR